MIVLRDYQRNAVDSIYAYWERTPGNPLVVAPTGSGKSIILAQLIKEVLHYDPICRIMVLTHVKELIEQNLMTFTKNAPEHLQLTSVYSAGLKQKEDNQIVFAGIQSVYKADIQPPDIIIVDECHLIPRKSSTRYMTFLERIKEQNPTVKVVGLTATPYRLDTGYLHKGDGAIFNDIVYDIAMTKLIEDGYLVAPKAKGGLVEFDLTDVKMRMGEYNLSDVADAQKIQRVVTEKAIEETIDLCADRKGWLFFCAGVDHAFEVADIIREKGITCDVVVGDTPKDEREGIVSAFKNGETRALVNVNVLTTGFDAPHTDAIIFFRPTKSPGLYVQMIGRGMRPSPEKNDCLVLDYVGVCEEHGPVDMVEPPRKGKPADEKKARKCPSCQAIVAITCRECPDCGYVWPVIERKPARIASAYKGALISTDIEPEDWEVDNVEFDLHQKEGSKDSVRVTYYSGRFNSVSEWLCFDHDGYARNKALVTARADFGMLPVPKTTQEFLDRKDEANQIGKITVMRDGKYWRVLKRSQACR